MTDNDAIWALGSMSGTSLDGVDAAMLRSDGHEIFAFGETGFAPYAPSEVMVLRQALGKWPGEAGVAAAAQIVEATHTSLLQGFDGVDLVGFHGQTLAHEPSGRGTHQVGDGAVLARELGVPVVWDYRSADVALGGQGAPLAPFFHFACARWIGAHEPLAFVNLGGVGNITYVDPQVPTPESDGALLAFDTGPANAPINDLMMSRRGLDFDRDGASAAKGRADESVVRQFLKAPYFFKAPPKSLDRDDFADLAAAVADLEIDDAAASLVACVAASVAQAMLMLPDAPSRVLVTGGGRKNPALMAAISNSLTIPVEPVEAVGLNGDMLEAQAFAYLAIRVKNGLATSAPSTTGVPAAVGGGVISRPGR